LAVIPVKLTYRKTRAALSRREASFYRKLGIFLVAAVLPLISIGGCEARSVQKPVVAGSFYPADGAKLRKMVQKYLAEAGAPRIEREILGLIAPHAGYIYSGPVAGHAYKELRGRKYELVVVIAPSHTASINVASVMDMDAYRTPIGDIPIDREMTGRLIKAAPWIQYIPAIHAREHSLEVHLPFLQEALTPGYKIIPIVMGKPDPVLATALADILSETLRGKKVLYIASSDMSHYYPYDAAVKMDGKTLTYIKNGDTETLVKQCSTRESELCGLGPVQVMMHLGSKMGIDEGTVLKYANSGDTAGNRSKVVGYGSVAFVNPENDLSFADKQSLLTLARTTLEAFVNEGKPPGVIPGSKALREPGAAFVTLKVDGQLRGCIGHLRAIMPLYRSVTEMTVSSCSRDFRFTPVKSEELPSIRIEISVMSPFKKVRDISEIEVGRDGLYLAARGRSGVLLPQVPLEQGWNREKYLEGIGRKAGLPVGVWNEPGAELYRFSAQVFSE